VLNLDTSFLTEPSSSWKTLKSYRDAEKVVKSIAVTNDAAERGVKLAQDFLETSKSEASYQNILQVVEHDRKKQPNQRKYISK